MVRTMPSSNGDMILPSISKYDQSRQQPYLAYLDRLSRFLEQDDSLLVCCGYSFGDQHVNNVLFSALNSKRRAHVICLLFDDLDHKSDLYARACALPNLMVMAPKRGIVGAAIVGWQGDEKRCRDEGIPEAVIKFPNSPSKDAELGIGDFAVFAHFLESLGS